MDKKSLNLEQIKAIIPEPPLLDSIELDGNKCIATKKFRKDESFFKGHFPAQPVVPGVLLVRAFAQLGIIAHKSSEESKSVVLSGIHKARFKNPVHPDDELVFTLEKTIKDTWQGQATLNGDLACVVELSFAPSLSPQTTELDIESQNALPNPLNVEEVKMIIPHRPPFLFVDKVIKLDIGKECITEKTFGKNDYFFNECSPENNTVPSELIVEAAAQAGAIPVLVVEENKGEIAFFATITNAVFHKQVHLGEKVVLTTKMDKIHGFAGTGHSLAIVNGEPVFEAEIMFALPKTREHDNSAHQTPAVYR